MNEKNLDSYKLLSQLNFCVFDLETTGGNHTKDKIIEIGLIRVRDLEIVEEKDFLIQPEIKIPEFIQKLTSIKQSDVENCPIIDDVVDDVLAFMGDDILVAHNASFDVPFFNSVLKRLGREELQNKSICTNLMTKYLIPSLLNSNLNYMSKVFEISHHKAHRALDDADATAKLLIKFLHIFAKKNISKVNHLYYPKNRFELDRVNYKRDVTIESILEKYDSLKSSVVITLKGENGVILNSVPLLAKNSNPREREFLENALREEQWQVVTFKLIGPFIEGPIFINTIFNKLSDSKKEKLINFLWEIHLPDKKRSPQEESIEREFDQSLGDFFISNHIVPEQMTIYPICSIGPKSELIFRYPGHQKKLVQYINSKSNRISSKKMRAIVYPPLLRSFIEAYFKKNKEEFLFINKDIAKKSPANLYEKIDSYIEKNPNNFNFPNEYI